MSLVKEYNEINCKSNYIYILYNYFISHLIYVNYLF